MSIFLSAGQEFCTQPWTVPGKHCSGSSSSRVHFIQHHVLQFLVIDRAKIDVRFQRLPGWIKKKTQHSQLAHIYLKRDKRAMDKRNLKQSRNHESLKNVGFQVWKSSREPRWTEEQCTASTTYCCTKGQARNKLLGSCHTLLYLQQVGASSAAVPPAQHLGMDWGLRPAE